MKKDIAREMVSIAAQISYTKFKVQSIFLSVISLDKKLSV